MYSPAVVKTCWIVRFEDHGVSQTPSACQSQRACKVALGSGSVDEDASNAAELFTLGYGGVNVNRAVGPDAATVTAMDAVWDSAPFVPVTVTVYDPSAAPLIVQADVWVPLTLAGIHEVVPPSGVDAAVRATAPLKPPVDWREIVENADSPATNETVFGVAVMEKSGSAGGALTVTEIDVVWTRDPFVPVTVTVYDPGVELLSVHVDVTLPLMLERAHAAATPEGVEAAASATAPLKPPVEVREIVEVAL